MLAYRQATCWKRHEYEKKTKIKLHPFIYTKNVPLICKILCANGGSRSCSLVRYLLVAKTMHWFRLEIGFRFIIAGLHAEVYFMDQQRPGTTRNKCSNLGWIGLVLCCAQAYKVLLLAATNILSFSLLQSLRLLNYTFAFFICTWSPMAYTL